MGLFVIVLFTALALYLISVYNRLVTIRNVARNAFAQIDVQLTRRHDLIPNLVEVAKGYIKPTSASTLEAVIQARNSGGIRAEGRLSRSGQFRGDGAARRARKTSSAAHSAGCLRWPRPTRT
jgi:LemA protein